MSKNVLIVKTAHHRMTCQLATAGAAWGCGRARTKTRQSMLLWIVFSLVSAAGVTAYAGSFSVLVAFAIAVIVGLLLVRLQGYLLGISPKERVPAVETWVWAFNLRVFASIAISLILIDHYGMPFVGFNDDFYYDGTAQAHGLSYLGSLRHSGYPWFLGLLVKVSNSLGGYHYIIPRVINATVGAVLAAGIVQTAQALRPSGLNLKLLSLVCIVLPDYLYYSSLTLRDIIISYLWMLAMIAVLSKRPVTVRVAVLCATIASMYTLRHSYAALLALLVMASILVGLTRLRIRPAQLALGFMVLFIALGFVLPRVQINRGLGDDGVVATVSQEVSSGLTIATRDEPLAPRTQSGLQRVFDLLPFPARPAFFSVFQFFAPVPFWRVGGDTTLFNWLFLGNGFMWLLISSGGAVTLAGMAARRVIPPQITTLILFGLVPIIASGVTYGIVRYRLPGIAPILVLVFCCFQPPRDKRRLIFVVAALVGASLVWDLLRFSFI